MAVMPRPRTHVIRVFLPDGQQLTTRYHHGDNANDPPAISPDAFVVEYRDERSHHGTLVVANAACVTIDPVRE